MRNVSSRFLVSLYLGLSFLVCSGQAAGDQLTTKQIYRQTLRATAVVLTRDGSGSGWLADAGARLLVTNHHVVGRHDVVAVLFPLARDGKVVAERSYYVTNAQPVRGKVLDTDPRRDLAVIELESVPAEARALTLAAEGPDPSDRVHSIGNPGRSDALWVYTSGTVRQVYRQQFKYGDGQEVDARLVVTQSPINPGDSGGPVVNDDGELVGVTAAAQADARLMSCCIEVGEVKSFLTQARRLLGPDSAAAYNDRGLYYHQKGRHDRAIADFTDAIRLDPRFGTAYRNRAIASGDKGDYDQAIADCTHALRIEGNDPLAYRHRGYAYGAKGEVDRAIADFSAALRLDPKDAGAHHHRGTAYARKGDYDQAITDFTAALRLDPTRAGTYKDRAAAFRGKGDYLTAIADCTEALRLAPTLAGAYHERGHAFHGKGDYDRAIADFTAAIRLDPKDAGAYVGRSRAYRHKGEPAKADADYAEAVRLNPALKAPAGS